MGKQRILYIDLMKGLSITWVVWFHTTHPSFVNYGFRMPLFFLASAIFFKMYPIKEFIEKKVYQICIPFVFFYLIYYLFMILSYAISNNSLAGFDYSCIFDIFKPYKGNGGPTVNPPLWFIMALLNLQIILYISASLIKNRICLLFLSLAISLFASVYLFETYTYFQFGRALRYFFYYAFGYLYGKDIIKNIEENHRKSAAIFLFAASVLAVTIVSEQFLHSHNSHVVIDYFQITALVVLLIYLFRLVQNLSIMRPLKYYGSNSYIVLGCNEMILSSLLVLYLHLFGQMNVVTGFFHWILTMVFLIPVIKVCNRYIPELVGKKNFFEKYHRNK